MKHYIVKTDFGTYEVTISVDKYRYNNALAIELVDAKDFQPFAIITVCIDHDRMLNKDESFVDTNNCPWAEDFIEQNHLGEFTGEIGYSGFCQYPLYRFNLNELNK